VVPRDDSVGSQAHGHLLARAFSGGCPSSVGVGGVEALVLQREAGDDLRDEIGVVTELDGAGQLDPT